jgi:Tfp pilus assembly PilM family ATPase
MIFGTYIAGISVADEQAHLAVFQAGKGAVRLRYLGESARSSPSDLWFLDELLAGRDRILRKVSRASVALDHNSAIEHCFPADSSLSGADEQDQINWELSNLIPAFNPEEYTREKHLLQTHAHRQYSDTLIVAYRKSFVESAKAILMARKIGLDQVGTNHFGAQHALVLNNPEVKSTMVALVHVMRNRVDVGLINHGKLVRYRSALTASVADLLEFLGECLSPFPVSNIFLYGASLSGELIEQAKGKFSSGVAKLNPFTALGAASSFREFESFKGKEHRFAAAVGSALRNH